MEMNHVFISAQKMSQPFMIHKISNRCHKSKVWPEAFKRRISHIEFSFGFQENGRL